MQRETARITAACATVLLLWSVAAWGAEPAATLSFFIGEVSVKSPGLAPAVPAKLAQPLREGETVVTGGESRAEITLSAGRGVMRVAENSRLVLETLSAGDSARTAARLDIGSIWSRVRELTGDRQQFEVRSPTAAAAVRGTVFGMDVAADTSALVRVYDGRVQLGWIPQQTFSPGQILQAPTEVSGPQEISQNEWIEVLTAGRQVRLGADRSAAVGTFDAAQDAGREWASQI